MYTDKELAYGQYKYELENYNHMYHTTNKPVDIDNMTILEIINHICDIRREMP